MRSILFYSDAAEYGGHEAMTMEVVRNVCEHHDLHVSFVFYARNKRLCEQLERLKSSSGNLALIPLEFHTKSLQALRSLISWRKVEKIRALMAQVRPDAVVVSQGRIEASSLGLLAAKRAGYLTISYLPVAHSVAVSGRPFAVWIREMVNRYFYRLPDKIITINESARHMLLERGASNVVVVPNAVQTSRFQECDRLKFRESHGIGDNHCLVATIGRFHFRDKGQDFAVRAIARFRQELHGYKFIFIGEGSDEDKLKDMISSFNLTQQVQVLPWTPNPAEIYAGLDLLLIPSRFEGVPLVMLEAMSYKLPVVASNSDGMAELLPQEWLFPFGDHRALVDRLKFVRNANNSEWLESNYKRVMDGFSSAKFRESISAAILG
jgi:glycosyltransferase involved in cell wall biosynthesis